VKRTVAMAMATRSCSGSRRIWCDGVLEHTGFCAIDPAQLGAAFRHRA
jgi:hypothetical protein